LFEHFFRRNPFAFRVLLKTLTHCFHHQQLVHDFPDRGGFGHVLYRLKDKFTIAHNDQTMRARTGKSNGELLPAPMTPVRDMAAMALKPFTAVRLRH